MSNLPPLRRLIPLFILLLSVCSPNPSQSADFDDLIELIAVFKSGDENVDHLDVFFLAATWKIGGAKLIETSPLDGEVDVAITRETIVRFDRPIDESSLTEFAVFGKFGDNVLPASQHLSPDRRTITLFYDDPLPPSARIRVFINGNMLRGEDDILVDADLDGVAGGVGTIDFDTLTLATIPGTSVFGRVFASELVTAKGTTQPVNNPLEGVVITVDGAESTLRAVTDNMGNFTLDPAPAGKFFVHIDGREVQSALIEGETTTTTFPGGPYYPFVGKPWVSVAGQATDVGDVYLPLVLEGALQPVSQDQDTMIGFPAQVVSAHPEFAGVALMVPADSLFSDDGTRGGRVGIAPVSPDRLPGTLPEGLEFPIVITVQTDGATNFDVPAPVCFPNLPDPVTGEPLPPGTQDSLYSFNHDKGIWEEVGSVTVSEDGSLVCSDPGSGILAPGWHGTGPRSVPSPPPPPPPKICVRSQAAVDACKDRAQRLFALNLALCTAIMLAGGALCYTLIVFFPIGLPAFYLCLAAVLVAFTACLEVIRNDRDMRFAACEKICQPVAKGLTPLDKIDPPPLDDPIVEALVAHVEDFSQGMLPRLLQAGEITTESAEQIAQDTLDLLDRANAMAGGDAMGYLLNYATQKEEEADALAEEFGTAPIDAPPYPILYLAEIHRPDSILNFRGETGPNGRYRIFIPRDGALRRICFYDPRTNEFGTAYPKISPNATEAMGEFILGPVDGFPDFDGEGLVDVAEMVVGTEIDNPDTDGDGVSDWAEVDQGTNPLDGLPVRQGIVATADIPGTVLDICAEDELVAIARGFDGIAVLNVFNRMNPRIIVQVDTPGLAQAVSCSGDFVAVADGPSGCAIIDISDPPAAKIIHQLDLRGNARSVVTNGALAYVGLFAGRIYTIDMVSGAILGQTAVDRTIADISFANKFLSVLQPGRVTLFSVEGGLPHRVGTVETQRRLSLTSRSRIFNGFPIVYYNHFMGVYDTLDIADPRLPIRLGRAMTTQGAGQAVAANGSGIVLTAHQRAASGKVGVYDDSDHLVTDSILFEVDTPGNPVDVSIFNGLCYVADNGAGVQVINYLPYDALGVPPTIELEADFIPEAPKISKGLSPQVEEGKSALLVSSGTDDVQIGNVEFFIDGERVKKDGGFPFEHRFVTARIIDQPTFTIRAKATDTGGNSTFTETVVVTLTADGTPPDVLFVSPERGESIGEDLTVAAFFNEPLDEGSVSGNALQVSTIATKHGDPVSGGTLSYREDLSAVFLTFTVPLPPGLYRAEVGPPIADLIGNEIVDVFTWNFESPFITTVEGLVEFDGNPVGGAEVTILGGIVGPATTTADGRFSIPNVRIPFDSSLSIAVSAQIGAETLFGGVSGIDPVHQGVTDVGTLVLGELCDPQITPGLFPLPGVDGVVHAMVTFDDGGGPALYIGGKFTIAGDRLIDNIAKWDGSVFVPVGQFLGEVYSLALYDDGTGEALYAGTDNIYKWTGTDWVTLDSGVGGAFNNVVSSLTTYNDELYAGGQFTTVGGIPADGIAKWDGTSWSAVGDPLTNDPFSVNVSAMTQFGSDLYVGGNIKMAGPLEVNGIARWDGLAWSAVIDGVSLNNVFAGSVRALDVWNDGMKFALYVGGFFTSAGGLPASNIASWDGASWAALGGGIQGEVVESLAVYDDGSGSALYAGGDFNVAGATPTSHIAKWDGASWSTVGFGVTALSGGVTPVEALLVHDGGTGDSLYAAGAFVGMGTAAAWSVAAWNGANWSTLFDGLNGAVTAIEVFDDGSGPALIAAGDFSHDGNLFLNHIAKREGNTWLPLAEGITPSGGSFAVSAFEVFDDGAGDALYVGGNFPTAGTATVNGIAKWDGQEWFPLESGVIGVVNDLTVFDDGGGEDLYAVGGFGVAGGTSALGVARWNGAEWSPVGEGFNNASASTIEVYDDGTGATLYAGGNFTFSGATEINRIARWNGSSWEPLGFGTNGSVGDLAVFDAGSGPELFAVGNFNTAGGLSANGVAKWDGTDWSPVGQGTQRTSGPLLVFDDGSGPALYGANILQPRGVAKWDGVNWTSVGINFPMGAIGSLESFDDGNGAALFIGGGFLKTGSGVSAFMGRYSRPLPPCE